MFREYVNRQEEEKISHNIFEGIRENKKIFDFLKAHWTFNFNQIGFPEIPEKMFQFLLQAKGKNDDEIIEELNNIQNSHKEFKRHARRSRRFDPKMGFNYHLLKPYLKEKKDFLDFGCGKMAIERRIVKEETSLERLYAYDPKVEMEYIHFDPKVVFFNKKEELEGIKDIDIVYSSFVFHHLTEEEISYGFRTIHKSLKENGIFILLEESFAGENSQELLEISDEKLKEVGYEVNKELSIIFENLSTKEKLLAIYFNDVLGNMKNLHYMPWTFEYRTMEKWQSEVEKYGFKLKEKYYFGVAKNEKLKQGITSMQVFEKIKN